MKKLGSKYGRLGGEGCVGAQAAHDVQARIRSVGVSISTRHCRRWDYLWVSKVQPRPIAG